jgi:hypothetical protein
MSSPQSDLTGIIITASVAILVAVITAVAGKLYEQHLKIRDELRAKKAPIYEKHIATFFKLLLAPKITGKAPNQEEAAVAFAAVAEQMIVWGSADVIKAWNNFKTAAQTSQGIDLLEGIFTAMRKDLGHDDQNLKKGELLRLFVNDLPPADRRQ